MMEILKIRADNRNNLMISEDTGEDDEPIAVLLFTPDMMDLMEHLHVELSVDQVYKLYEWAGKFLTLHKPNK